ncbi:spermidine synthase-like [Protopterus annectens]|uniref:spermidine synthase-like n=1 Tax=Protopterus annectens TaxID=7888 RepID=UPI001CFA30BC|nr:spermidine synthase-like [Protopterus annectens]
MGAGYGSEVISSAARANRVGRTRLQQAEVSLEKQPGKQRDGVSKIHECKVREVQRHEKLVLNSLKTIHALQDVITVSKKYLPGMSQGYSNPKLTLHVGDGFEFMKQNQDAFDVIITDSSDPVGPAESLFKESYYQLMKTALHEGGILCCQAECQWLHLELIKEMKHFCKSLFPAVDYAYCTIPTYPSGQIGFLLCSKNPVSILKLSLLCNCVVMDLPAA